MSADSDACTKILEKARSQLEEIGQRRIGDSQAFNSSVADSLRLIPVANSRFRSWYNTSCILSPSKANRLTNLKH